MAYNTPKELFTGICDAIRAKDGTTAGINHQDIPARIRAIKTGVDTSDATAKSSDILKNVTAYVDGDKITGSIETYDGLTENWYKNFVLESKDTNDSLYNGSGYMTNYRLNSSGTTTASTGSIHSGFIQMVKGSIIRVYGGEDPDSYTGNYFAFYNDSHAVVSAYNFTTCINNGYLTYEVTSDGTYLATFDTSLLGTTSSNAMYFRVSLSTCSSENFVITINDTIKGTVYKTSEKYCDDNIYVNVLNTSDATAIAGDIVEGKTAYVNGEKITGTVTEYPKNHILVMRLGDQILGANSSTPQFQSETFGMSSLFRQGSAIQIQTNADTFGNATAADVTSGKTFTSSAGVKITGTGGGLAVKSGTTTSATINTGLSSVSYFIIYKSGISAAGLIDAVYNGSTTNMNYCSAWSSSAYGTKTFKSGTATPTISGGTITWNITSATSGGLSSGTTYNWMAIGTA